MCYKLFFKFSQDKSSYSLFMHNLNSVHDNDEVSLRSVRYKSKYSSSSLHTLDTQMCLVMMMTRVIHLPSYPSQYAPSWAGTRGTLSLPGSLHQMGSHLCRFSLETGLKVQRGVPDCSHILMFWLCIAGCMVRSLDFTHNGLSLLVF